MISLETLFLVGVHEIAHAALGRNLPMLTDDLSLAIEALSAYFSRQR